MSLRKYVHAMMTDQRRDPVLSVVLWFLSLLYGVVVAVTRCCYQWHILPRYQAPRPVISVGNLTVGGTGKTPLVIAVVRILLMRQYKVAVLTRGYMPAGSMHVSDEAKMLQEELPGVPVLVGANRRQSIEEGLQRHAIDVFVCDDAFSHWPLKRDLDILAVDARNPFGNGHLLPRGILREPIVALGRSQLVVLTKCRPNLSTQQAALTNQIKAIQPGIMVFESRHGLMGCVDVFEGTSVDHVHFKGVRVLAFCALADPNAFRDSLQEAGFDTVNLISFMDHHVYSLDDVEKIRRQALDNQIQIIMTTHKDAVKMRNFKDSFEGFHVYYLQMELDITHGKNVFIDRIVAAVAG